MLHQLILKVTSLHVHLVASGSSKPTRCQGCVGVVKCRCLSFSSSRTCPNSSSRRAARIPRTPTQPNPYSHRNLTPNREHAEVLLRLLRCVPHTRQHERAQGAQQRSQPLAQRPGLLRADFERPDTASHQQYYGRVQCGRPGESPVCRELDRTRLSRRRRSADAIRWSADGIPSRSWVPTTR